jgi:hypothetical protein
MNDKGRRVTGRAGGRVARPYLSVSVIEGKSIVTHAAFLKLSGQLRFPG